MWYKVKLYTINVATCFNPLGSSQAYKIWNILGTSEVVTYGILCYYSKLVPKNMLNVVGWMFTVYTVNIHPRPTHRQSDSRIQDKICHLTTYFTVHCQFLNTTASINLTSWKFHMSTPKRHRTSTDLFTRQHKKPPPITFHSRSGTAHPHLCSL